MYKKVQLLIPGCPLRSLSICRAVEAVIEKGRGGSSTP